MAWNSGPAVGYSATGAAGSSLWIAVICLLFQARPSLSVALAFQVRLPTSRGVGGWLTPHGATRALRRRAFERSTPAILSVGPARLLVSDLALRPWVLTVVRWHPAQLVVLLLQVSAMLAVTAARTMPPAWAGWMLGPPYRAGSAAGRGSAGPSSRRLSGRLGLAVVVLLRTSGAQSAARLRRKRCVLSVLCALHRRWRRACRVWTPACKGLRFGATWCSSSARTAARPHRSPGGPCHVSLTVATSFGCAMGPSLCPTSPSATGSRASTPVLVRRLSASAPSSALRPFDRCALHWTRGAPGGRREPGRGAGARC